MICSLKFKKNIYLKNVALDFVLLVLKLYPIQVVISLSLWTKFTMGQLLLFFLCNFSSFFSLRWRCPRNQPFFTVIDSYVDFGYSANYNPRGAFCDTLFDLQQSSELPQKPLYHGHNNRKWLKLPQSHFHSTIPCKVTIFCCFDVCFVRPPEKF